MTLKQLPNLITLLRVLLLIPLSYLLSKQNYTDALLLFLIAGFSDALDGFLAKQFGWTSRFGAILDPLADKALLVITMLILTLNGVLSWGLFVVVVVRDLFIISGAYYYHRRLGPYEMDPSYLSKFNTFTQILMVFSLLVSLGYKPLPELYLQAIVFMTYLTTISSGVHYGVVWGRKFSKELSARNDSTAHANSKHANNGKQD